MDFISKFKTESGWEIVITEKTLGKNKVVKIHGFAKRITEPDKFSNMYAFVWEMGKLHWTYPDSIPTDVKTITRSMCLEQLKKAGRETKRSYKKYSAGR